MQEEQKMNLVDNNTTSVVTYLIRELMENRLLALRYDKDSTLDEIVDRAKAMEEQKMHRLVEYSREMTTPTAPVDYVVREFKKINNFMATLETQYHDYLQDNPNVELTFIQWYKEVFLPLEASREDLKREVIDPVVSDNFQIGPDGAYEHEEDSENDNV
jgi:predicted AAA+ superfamily ATPase